MSWRAANDRDGDVQGYRVYIASRSRGWYYSVFCGAKSAQTYWSSCDGWEPEMYDALFVLPPHDINLRETTERYIEIPLAGREELFVTITAFDKYHESVGRRHYLPSNELRIQGAHREQLTKSNHESVGELRIAARARGLPPENCTSLNESPDGSR